jgi:hypothetical protein
MMSSLASARLAPAALLGAVGLALGCGHDVVVTDDSVEVARLPPVVNRDLDVLLLMDNSPGMSDNQAALVRALPSWINTLSGFDGGLPNLHIGVATSDLGSSASLDGVAPGIGMGQGACNGTGDGGALRTNAAVTGAFVSDVGLPDHTRSVNYIGNLADVLSTTATTGDQGCGFEQHLRATVTAVSGLPASAGFLRPEANLAILILADEDDCSVSHNGFFNPADVGGLGPLQSFRCTQFGLICDGPDDMTAIGARTGCRPRPDSPYIDDVAPLVDALVAVKGDRRRVMASVIAGTPTPVEIGRWTVNNVPDAPLLAHSCTFTPASGSTAVADPAVRLSAAVDQLGAPSSFETICAADLGPTLARIGGQMRQLLGDPCLDGVALFDASTAPGLQPSCEVTDVRDGAPDQPESIPACAVGTAPTTACWTMSADAALCPNSAGNLKILFSGDRPAVPDRWTHVRCRRAP